MEITTNKPIDQTTLRIVKESFEEQKNVYIPLLYTKNNDIYGIYINNIYDSLSFIKAPLTNMRTDIDGHNIFMFELGFLLHLIYQNGSMQMYNILINHGNDILHDSNTEKTDVDTHFHTLIKLVGQHPPLQLSSFHLINWIDELNNGNLNMSINDLMDMVENFMITKPLDVDISDKSSEVLIKNNLNLVRQELKSQNFDKITELTINTIDRIFINLQICLYNTDNK